MSSVPRRAPLLAILSDNLEAPPRAGEHIHLLSLARAVAPHCETRAFAWVGSAAGGEAGGAAGGAAGSAAGGAATSDWRPWSVAPGAPPGTPSAIVPIERAGAPRGALARRRHYLRCAWSWLEREAPPGSTVWVRRHPTAMLLLPRLLLPRRRRRFRLIYDASSFLRLEWASGARPRADLVKALIEERLWRRFDCVRTLCDPMRDYLVRRGVPAERVLVVPVGTERRARHWRPAAAPHRVLYVGSAMAWQGLPALLAAMEQLATVAPAVRLTVVGVEAGAVEARFRTLPNLDLRGRLVPEEAAALCLEHDLFVLPRPRQPLTDRVVPMKVVEAMGFGIPILATELAAVRWVTGDLGAIFLPDNRPATLARGIQAALADRARLLAVGDAGLRRVERFYWDRVGAEIAARLQSLATTRP